MRAKNLNTGDDPANDIHDNGFNVTSFTVSKKCCSRVGFAKYGLFIINFLVWAAGGALIGVGIWSRLQQQPSLAAFDQVTVNLAYLLIGIGGVMFVVSLFGCVGALRESLCLMKMFVVAVVVVFVGQLVAGILAFVLLDTVEASMMDFLKDTVVSYHTPHASIDKDLDKLQKEYSCCGASSYQDWEANVLYNCSASTVTSLTAASTNPPAGVTTTTATTTACSVPESCCLRPGPMCADKARRYSEDFARLLINTRGCLGALMSIFRNNLIIVGLLAFVVGFLQVCSLLMAHCLMRYIVMDVKLIL